MRIGFINRKILIFFLLALFSLYSSASAGDFIYVKWNASGANDGSSWSNAYTSLQDALSTASADDTIFVAKGTYYPDISTKGLATKGDRNESFFLKSGIVLMGGYSGNEPFSPAELSQSAAPNYNKYWRNWEINKTILSGDLSKNDNDNISADEPTRSDNSIHVISSTAPISSTEINGFYIQAGNANGSTNSAKLGGGVYSGNSSLHIKNCYFSNNSALEEGGAVYAPAGAILIKFATFINNTAKRGGALSLAGNDHLANPTTANIINSYFYRNQAQERGGAVYAELGVNPFLINSVFTENHVLDAGSTGGGFYADNKSYPEIINCTFYNNSAVTAGAGIVLSAGRVSNSIFRNNNAAGNAQIFLEGSPANPAASRTFLTSIVQGGFQGLQVRDTDPMFAQPGDPAGADDVFGTNDDGLRLQSASTAIDSGTNWINVQYSDAIGYPRRSHNLVDIGAYEHQRVPVDYEQLYNQLKNGGYILVFRHGMTDWSQTDQPGYLDDIENCSLQRNLSDDGLKQVKFISDLVKLLDIPIDTSISSPMCRCKYTGEIISGGFIPQSEWMFDDASTKQAKLEDLGRTTKSGFNSIIATHMNVIESVTTFPKGEVQEGDAVVIKPLGGTSFQEIGQISTDTWEKMLSLIPVSPVSVENNNINPAHFVLYDNYPNPFNPATNIKFSIPEGQIVSLKVYDALGEEVAELLNEYRSPGTYDVVFNATGLSSGVYFYTLKAGEFSQTKKLALLK